jgi:hypothetical protein
MGINRNSEQTTSPAKRAFFRACSWLFVVPVFLLLLNSVIGQELPDKIRGYKVHKANISVLTANQPSPAIDAPEARVTIGEPSVSDISLSGLTLEVPAEIIASGQSGKVDFLTFQNFRVNGLTVEVEEYRDSFEFKKEQLVELPAPAKIYLRADRLLRGAWKEMTESKDEWTITGRIFVFGKFKKMGMNFKRVVPVDISIKIKNPLIDL